MSTFGTNEFGTKFLGASPITQNLLTCRVLKLSCVTTGHLIGVIGLENHPVNNELIESFRDLPLSQLHIESQTHIQIAISMKENTLYHMGRHDQHSRTVILVEVQFYLSLGEIGLASRLGL